MHQKHPPAKIAVSKLMLIVLSDCFSGLIIQFQQTKTEKTAWK
ncbi:hypothetical protein HMPREF0494_1652 [Limosilactobacillus antri DSM 16041]|uniref:Uncharacterized protein n=1 Tax=Limosilactobacillus antri DSM 16041 TaxID=525309 RepID=C8P8K8_9LACO|nr:hypothetical protein HMPREF0494_1652 [Limosilactobacillus antri DSM 16041]